jgi:hypothetical protein
MKVRFILCGLSAFLLAAATTVGQGAWKEFTWKEGKCSVLLPGTPTVKKDSLQLAQGDTLYMILFADTPGMAKADEKLLKKVFDDARDGLVKTLKGGKLVGETPVKLGKSLGREVRIEAEAPKSYRTRLYYVGDRYYQLILMGSKEATGSKDAEKFFGSFKVTR